MGDHSGLARVNVWAELIHRPDWANYGGLQAFKLKLPSSSEFIF